MKNNSIDILKKTECTGCSVCYKVCPHNAIEMIETKEGFHHPIVLEDKCTDCGLCVKKCHALNDNFRTDFKQLIYDVRANDEIRMKSSSGGMFTLLADYVFENNGYVCGASFTDDWLGAEHVIIDDKKDLNKLRGSKYIESNLCNTFIEIKKLLNEKKQVLFTGCPCQVSALYSYLGKDYDNLLTADLLCNSIVPQKVWVKYLKELFTNDEIKDIEYISFRDKEKIGWRAGLYIKSKNKEYIDQNEMYNKLFLEHIAVKEECLHCKYRKYERVGDISIGDYWGVKDNDNKGVSLVLINTDKGNKVFNKIKKYCKYEDVTLIKPSNGGIGGNMPIFFSRKYFFDNLENESLEKLYKNSLNPKYNVAILNMMFQNNFGAVLTYYALFYLIKNSGYNPILIYNSYGNNGLYDNVMGCKTALKYLNVGNEVFSKEELQKYTDKCDTFIVGSDQVWRYDFFGDNIFYYLLDFVPNNKKKISYSSSFGIDTYNGNKENKVLFKNYLNQFDYVSVREDTGVDICKSEFNVDAVHILDPVFLLEVKDYNYLISKSKLKIDYDYIAVYNLRSDLNNIINTISDKLKLKVITINFNYSVEDWLYIIKNSKYLITDSFHGICFAIIFNIPFVITLNEEAGISRILSISKQFNFEDRIIKDINEITDKKLNNIINMDFTEINNKLKIEKERSLNWLINALKTPKKINRDSYKDDIINLLIEKNNQLSNEIIEKNTHKDDVINSLIEKNTHKDDAINLLIEKNIKLDNELKEVKENINWIKLFGICNNKNYIYIYIFGIKGVIRATEKNINKIAWWIPVKKWREAFRDKFRKFY